MTTEDVQIHNIELTLHPVEHVTWDRYTKEGNHWTIYGWVERDDAYKDFIVVDFDFYPDDGFGYSFTTSSAKYSEYFHNVMQMDGEHSPCIRAEDTFKHLNTVKLS
jgi:hypothetical protein